MKDSIKILISFLIISTTFGCKKNITLPNTPVIELLTFNETTIAGQKEINISFKFTDGDGDFGLNEDESTLKIDTIMPICTDTGIAIIQTELIKSISSLFAILKEKKDTLFIESYITSFNKTCQTTDTITLHQTLPRVAPRGTNKTLEGTIETQFVIPIEEAQVKRGTSKIEIYIEDRAKNKSNVIFTPEFSF